MASNGGSTASASANFIRPSSIVFCAGHLGTSPSGVTRISRPVAGEPNSEYGNPVFPATWVR